MVSITQQRKHILLVEDEVIIALAEKNMLEKYGFEVSIASSSKKTLKLIDEDHYDLILMDINLGNDMPGTELAKKILKKQNLPIVFLTSYTDKKTLEQAKNISKYGYLIKNSGEFVLIEAINMAFQLFKAHENNRSEKVYLDTILNSIENGVIAVDLEGKITKINHLALKLCGFKCKSEDLLNQPLEKIAQFVEKSSRKIIVNPVLDVIHSEKPINYNDGLLLLSQSRQEYSLSLSCAPIFNHTYNIDGAVLVFRDVTAEIQNEQNLEQYVSILNSVIEQSPAPMVLVDYPDMRVLLYNNIFLEYLEIDLENGDFKKSIKDIQITWKKYDSAGNRIVFEDSPLMKAFNGISTHGEEVKLVTKSGEIRYCLIESMPIYNSLGQLIAGFLMLSDITQQKKIEKTLMESRERFKAISTLTFEGILIHHNGVVVEMNDALSRITGYSRDELIGKNIIDIFIHPDSKKKLNGKYQQEDFSRLEIKIIHKNGELKLVELQTGNIDWDGKSMTMFNLKDITNKMKTQQALEFTRLGMEYSQIGIFQVRDDGLIEYANRYACEMLGYEFDELLKMYIYDIDCNLNKKNWPNRRLHIKDKQKLFFETIHQHKNGTKIPVEITLNYIEMFDKQLTLTFVTDITERKKNELALIESKERLSLAVDGAGVGLWDWRIEERQFVINKRWAEMLGYNLDELEPVNVETWKRLCHPVDLDISEKLLKKHFLNKISSYECELRMKHKSGKWIWILERGKVSSRNDKGEPLRMTGTHIDITKRKEAESQLELFMWAVESSSNAIGISTPSGNHFYQNKAFDDLFGVIGSDPPSTVYVSQEVGREVFSCIKSGKPWTGEVEMYDKEGNIRYIQLFAYSLFDAYGNINGLVGVHVDITEEKRINEELRTNQKRLSVIFNSSKELKILISSKDKISFKITDVNDSCLSISKQYGMNFKKSYIIGKDFGYFLKEILKMDSEKQSSIINRLQMALNEMKPISYESRYQSDFISYEMEFSIIPIVDPDSEYQYVLWTAYDISKHKNLQRSISKLLEEKKYLLKEVHHRIKNDMSIIHSLLTMQASSIENQDAAFILQEAQNRIHLMGTIYNNLYQGDNYKEIEISQFIYDLFAAIKKTYEVSTLVQEDIEIQKISIPSKQALQIGILLNELITNCYKYAFKEEQAVIKIRIKLLDDMRIDIVISDNGQGLPKSVIKDKKYGFGLTLVSWIVEQNLGLFEIANTGQGSFFHITMSLNKS